MTRDRLAHLAAPLVAAALVVLATAKRGPALSPDSAIYLSVADHLAHGRGWTQFDGAPYVRWAPLYPWVLSLGPRVGIAAATVARVLQPLALACSVALCDAWLGRHVRSFAWRAVALALIALSTIGIESAAFVWSDSFDLAFTLGALVALDAWVERGSDRLMVTAAVCTGLACLTRYASLVLVPVGILALLSAPRTVLARERLGATMLFTVYALTPIALWMARNADLGQGLLGATPGSAYGWVELTLQWANAGSHWVSPESSPVPVRAAALLLFVVALLATLVTGFRRSLREDPGAWRAPALLIVFLFVYRTAVIVGAHSTAVEPIEERYLAPVFAPLVLVLAWAAERAAAWPAGALARRGLPALVGLWLVFTALRTADRERGYLGDGAWGLNNARWSRSELLAAVRHEPPRGLVYSNAPDALYALAGIEARLSPRHYPYHSPGTRVDDLERFPASVDSAGAAALVWFAGEGREFLATPEELGRLRPRAVRARFADGEVDGFAGARR